MAENNDSVGEFRYVVDVEQKYKGPKVLASLTKWGFHYGESSIIYLGIMGVTKLLTGKTVEEESYIVIYKKLPGFMGDKTKVYEEKVPSDVKGHIFARNLYHLEKAAEKGELSGTLELLLRGEKRFSRTHSVDQLSYLYYSRRYGSNLMAEARVFVLCRHLLTSP